MVRITKVDPGSRADRAGVRAGDDLLSITGEEIRDVLAYLCVVNNPLDDVHLRRIINVPRRGIGDKSIAAAEAMAVSQGMPLLELMRHAEEYRAIPAAAARAMNATGWTFFSFFTQLVSTHRRAKSRRFFQRNRARKPSPARKAGTFSSTSTSTDHPAAAISPVEAGRRV